MTIEVKVPMLPESIADATIATWHKKVGEQVSRDENLVDLETDKVMLEVPAPADGILKEILKPSGETVQANQIVAIIEPGHGAAAKPSAAEVATPKAEKTTEKTAAASDTLSPSARRAAAAQRRARPHEDTLTMPLLITRSVRG